MIEWTAAALAVFYSLGALSLALLFFSHLRIPDARPSARVTLVLPATGPLPRLEGLLDALAAQSLQPRRLIVSVESREDPAFGRVSAMAERYRQLNIEPVVAGLSPLRAQKCTNLLAALACLDADDEHVVFLDADIRPQPWWLGALAAPLAGGHADIVNGYRWQVPTKLTLAIALVAGIDRAIAVLPRLRQLKTIWGGSLALSRHAVETLDLPTTIGRTLTEDLPIGDRAAQTGLRVLTRRAVRVPTPLDGRFGHLWRFGRRQYQLIRLYRPGLWTFAAVVVTSDLIARLVLVSALTAAGTDTPGLAAPAILVVACLGSIATEIRLAIGKRLGVPDGIGVRLSQHLLAWTILPTACFHASVIWGGFVTSPVRWAHIRYVIDSSGRVTEVARLPPHPLE